MDPLSVTRAPWGDQTALKTRLRFIWRPVGSQGRFLGRSHPSETLSWRQGVGWREEKLPRQRFQHAGGKRGFRRHALSGPQRRAPVGGVSGANSSRATADSLGPGRWGPGGPWGVSPAPSEARVRAELGRAHECREATPGSSSTPRGMGHNGPATPPPGS